MHVKNGIKDLKRYPQISRRVRDTLARRMPTASCVLTDGIPFESPGGPHPSFRDVGGGDGHGGGGDGRDDGRGGWLLLRIPFEPPSNPLGISFESS